MYIHKLCDKIFPLEEAGKQETAKQYFVELKTAIL